MMQAEMQSRIKDQEDTAKAKVADEASKLQLVEEARVRLEVEELQRQGQAEVELAKTMIAQVVQTTVEEEAKAVADMETRLQVLELS